MRIIDHSLSIVSDYSLDSIEDKVKSKGLAFAPDKLGIRRYLSFFTVELRSDVSDRMFIFYFV